MKPSREQLFARLKYLARRPDTEPARPIDDGAIEAVVDQLSDRVATSEKRIRALVDAIPLALMIVTETGRIEAANPKCLDLLRCARHADLLDHKLQEFFVTEEIKDPDESGKILQVGLASPQELMARRTDGELFAARVLFRPFDTSSNCTFVAIIEDITDRRQLEKFVKEHSELTVTLEKTKVRLETAEERIRTLTRVIPVGLLITTAKGRIEAVNPASLGLFKTDRYSDLIGHEFHEFFAADERIDFDAPETLLSRESAVQGVTARAADGSQFATDILFRKFVTASAAEEVLVVVADVTARQEVERLKQEFVSLISHDLRTPLTSIQCFLNLIVDGVFDANMAAVKEMAKEVETETSRLINMINSLLDIDKMEAGRLELCLESVPLQSIVTQAVRSVALLAHRRNVPIQVGPIDGELQVRADINYAIQVVVNLLSNAIKFSPSGSPIEVAVEVTEWSVKLTVTDSGPGIPKEFQERLFNRFEQARASDSRIKGGSGLGLAISKAIVDLHGGSIGMHGEEGQGSTFWFTLQRD